MAILLYLIICKFLLYRAHCIYSILFISLYFSSFCSRFLLHLHTHCTTPLPEIYYLDLFSPTALSAPSLSLALPYLLVAYCIPSLPPSILHFHLATPCSLSFLSFLIPFPSWTACLHFCDKQQQHRVAWWNRDGLKAAPGIRVERWSSSMPDKEVKKGFWKTADWNIKSGRVNLCKYAWGREKPVVNGKKRSLYVSASTV